MTDSRFSQLSVYLWQNKSAIEVDHGSLIFLAGVDVHNRCAATE